MGNTYFEYRSMHKYRRLARGQYGVEVKSMIDLVLMKEHMLRYVQDMRAMRGWDEASQITMSYCVK